MNMERDLLEPGQDYPYTLQVQVTKLKVKISRTTLF